MSSVKEAVKQSLMGSSDDELRFSHQIKANFYHHARKDDQSGELYMLEDDFINAIAPRDEDYVSPCLLFFFFFLFYPRHCPSHFANTLVNSPCSTRSSGNSTPSSSKLPIRERPGD